ncbi:hypothetical protein FM038_023590 [Shewanella eurypsychrophilus]|uniref:TPR repeat-containing protein n=1 Tax=Shewanella eurypsychrophilus TaxID=2593656 RepID=A0ABX6VBE0_9GAMM|nr:MULTISPECIES: hypothetical protein [Shewanella]QFU24816.1 hypothetical protein FS418_25245 [Shewanella sp. YLB-09]QPG60006.1 hypothetical protein FM038_023590 [Shewanella eurypsychrophilus]
MKKFLLGSLSSVLVLCSQMAMANDIEQIDAAANTMNLEQLQTLSQQGQDYAQAYAYYRLAISANVLSQPTLANSALSHAQSGLEALNRVSSNADNLALLASVYGMQIALDPAKVSIYGSKVGLTLTEAKTLEPNNPRVVLIQAISAFNTPSAYGGGMQKTIMLSNMAIDLFAEPCDNICWGHAEAYTWRGLAKQNSGDKQGALDDWQQAINVQTDYGWAHFLLKQNREVSQ